MFPCSRDVHPRVYRREGAQTRKGPQRQPVVTVRDSAWVGVDVCADGGGRSAAIRTVRLALVPKDAMDERNVILEIRAGTGGDEASIFAGDLFRMYERYAGLKGWRFEIVDIDGRRVDKILATRLAGGRRRAAA